MRYIPGERRRWWSRPPRGRAPAGYTPPAAGENSTVAGAVQLAIGVLTASLDSPELQAWAAWALIPDTPDALGDFIAGLHIVSQLLLHELHEATGQPPTTTLQKLAISAAEAPGTSFPE